VLFLLFGKPLSCAMGSLRTRADSLGVDKSRLIVKHSSSKDMEKHYEDIRELGQGAFGTVSLVRDRVTGQERVRKIVSTASMAPWCLDLMRKEIELLTTTDHPGVVKLYEYCEDVEQKELVLILEHMPGGTLEDLIAEGRPPLTEALVAKLMYQVLAALSYCHEQGIIHRDLKPDNILLSQGASVFGSPDCKLIDFGLACQGAPGQIMNPHAVGTPGYMAPEMVRELSYTAKADIWSVGVTAFQLLAGCQPFEGSETFEQAEADLYSEGGSWVWRWRGAEARDFVRLLLEEDPAKRPTAAEALEHPWLQRHEPAQHRFTQDIAQSLSNYASLPPIARCCLLIIATRVNVADLEMLGSFFLGADADGDGKLSQEDLEGALQDVQQSWWSWGDAVKVDAEKVLSAADLGHKGSIGYTEFVAGCISARHGSFEDLVRQAFYVLDTDRNGLISIHEVRHLFREHDAPLLDMLPQHRPFNQAEWCACLVAYGHAKQQVGPEDVFTHRRVRSAPATTAATVASI